MRRHARKLPSATALGRCPPVIRLASWRRAGVPLRLLVLMASLVASAGCNKLLGIGPPALADGGPAVDADTDSPPPDARQDAMAADAATDAMRADGGSACRFTTSNFGQCNFAP